MLLTWTYLSSESSSEGLLASWALGSPELLVRMALKLSRKRSEAFSRLGRYMGTS